MSLALVLFARPVLADPRTNAVWITSGTDGVNVIPYVRVDKKALFVDFDHFNGTMDYVYYNLNYKDRATGVLGGIEGSFATSPLPISGNYGGFDYVRQQLVFGTCSKNTCVYNSPKSVILTVNTHYTGGKIAQVTEVLNFPDNQF